MRIREREITDQIRSYYIASGQGSHDGDDKYDHISHFPSGKRAEAGNNCGQCSYLRKRSSAYANRNLLGRSTAYRL